MLDTIIINVGVRFILDRILRRRDCGTCMTGLRSSRSYCTSSRSEMAVCRIICMLKNISTNNKSQYHAGKIRMLISVIAVCGIPLY